jgi:hypothetical protein
MKNDEYLHIEELQRLAGIIVHELSQQMRIRIDLLLQGLKQSDQLGTPLQTNTHTHTHTHTATVFDQNKSATLIIKASS